jgi:hypothetical protein
VNEAPLWYRPSIAVIIYFQIKLIQFLLAPIFEEHTYVLELGFLTNLMLLAEKSYRSRKYYFEVIPQKASLP